jgi:hypothetical protein
MFNQLLSRLLANFNYQNLFDEVLGRCEWFHLFRSRRLPPLPCTEEAWQGVRLGRGDSLTGRRVPGQ